MTATERATIRPLVPKGRQANVVLALDQVSRLDTLQQRRMTTTSQLLREALDMLLEAEGLPLERGTDEALT